MTLAVIDAPAEAELDRFYKFLAERFTDGEQAWSAAPERERARAVTLPGVPAGAAALQFGRFRLGWTDVLTGSWATLKVYLKVM